MSKSCLATCLFSPTMTIKADGFSPSIPTHQEPISEVGLREFKLHYIYVSHRHLTFLIQKQEERDEHESLVDTRINGILRMPQLLLDGVR